MGILDDAIRQHLDLKRRQGAGEDELQRLEDEAFGPPSRPGEPDFPERGAGEEAGGAEAAAVATEAEEGTGSEVQLDLAEDAGGHGGADEAIVAGEQPSGDAGGQEALEPPIESLDTVEHPFERAGEEGGEAEAVEGELAEPVEGEGEGEDVLEETPEFLREQPEDDDLWFEQGEPKDFDF